MCSTLEGDLQRERVDHWCLDVAKSGLQERVAAQAAAVVELEGLTEKLSLQCSDKAQTVQVDLATAPHTSICHVPSCALVMLTKYTWKIDLHAAALTALKPSLSPTCSKD